MKTKTTVIAGLVILALIAIAVMVKVFFFPSVKNDYFAMSRRGLSEVPSGMLVLRATQFPRSPRGGVMYSSVYHRGKRVWRVMGRNVSFKELMATAYGQNMDRVVLPSSIPSTNFDFLVTIPGNLEQPLQKLIHDQLGFTAHTEKRDQAIFAMKIQDSRLPGLTVSEPDSKPGVRSEKNRINFTHLQVQEVTGGLERAMKTPVVDRTGLTNFYDFSIAWSADLEHRLENNATAPDAIKTILSAWGLALTPETDQVDMLVVQRGG